MAGQLYIWGFNNNGQLATNSTVSFSSPVQTVTQGTNWKQTFSGVYSAGGIKTDGTLWLWGWNNAGQLGDNTLLNKSSPVQTVVGGTDWYQADLGQLFCAAIKTDGTLWAWGQNTMGQLGRNNSSSFSAVPGQTVLDGSCWTQVSCGYRHIAAIKNDGTLWTWGRNTYGQLGDNTRIHRSSPVQTLALGNNWQAVECGDDEIVALKKDGTIWAWGGNSYGNLGDNSTIHRSSPVQIYGGGTNWIQISYRSAVGCAIKSDGTLWLWGYNGRGELGDNTVLHRSSPVQTVAGGNNWRQISHNLSAAALKKDNTLWTWGLNDYGQLGDNSVVHKSSPVQTAAFGNKWSFVSAGYRTSTAIYENTANQLGVNTQPVAGYNANQLLVQPKININDSAGSLVRIATNSVTVAVISGTATLSGTTTVTAVNGVATFADLVLTGSGSVTLRFTSSGLTQVDSSSFVVNLTLPIIPKRSEISDRIPTSGQLNIGELAINIDDKRGYIKKSDGSVLNIFNGKVYDGGTF